MWEKEETSPYHRSFAKLQWIQIVFFWERRMKENDFFGFQRFWNVETQNREREREKTFTCNLLVKYFFSKGQFERVWNFSYGSEKMCLKKEKKLQSKVREKRREKWCHLWRKRVCVFDSLGAAIIIIPFQFSECREHFRWEVKKWQIDWLLTQIFTWNSSENWAEEKKSC